MSPIERAARAAFEQGEAEKSTGFGVPWDDTSLANVREIFRRRTRAMLEALREPSEGMLEKGDNMGGFDTYRMEYNTTDIWQAMIDEALLENAKSADQ